VVVIGEVESFGIYFKKEMESVTNDKVLETNGWKDLEQEMIKK